MMVERRRFDSPLRFSAATAHAVAAAVTEVLPGDRFEVVVRPDAGHEGVRVALVDEPRVNAQPVSYWYFDHTYGGDDGYSDVLRVYFTSSTADCVDDHDPVGAPRVDDDPIVIARWIVDVVSKGPPTTANPAHPT